jgi:predicted HicB family RNase H-like nuclease
MPNLCEKTLSEACSDLKKIGLNVIFDGDGEYVISQIPTASTNLFVGEVVGLNDELGFHGTSVEELERMFHQSVDNYLAMCEEMGKEPEKEYKGVFNVRIPPELHRQAVLSAKEQQVSLNEFVTTAIREECTRLYK